MVQECQQLKDEIEALKLDNCVQSAKDSNARDRALAGLGKLVD